MEQQRHKAGPLKQSNKSHKDGRRGVKVASARSQSNIRQAKNSAKRQLSREERRNQAKQLRKQKREAVVSQRRELSVDSGRPLICAIIPLSNDVDLSFVTESLRTADSDAVSVRTERGYLFLGSARVQQRVLFVPASRDLYTILDVAKCADTILFVFATDPEQQLDEFGEHVLASVCAQGVPTAFGCLCGLNSSRFDARDRSAILARLERSIERFLSAMDGSFRTFAVDSPTETRALLQTVSAAKLRRLAWRDARPHMLVQHVEYEPRDAATGTLRCYGYLQGERSLSVNQLVYVPGWHEYQMAKVDCFKDPFPLRQDRTNRRKDQSSNKPFDGLTVTRTCVPDPSKQEALVDYTTMDAELEPESGPEPAPEPRGVTKTILKESAMQEADTASDSESESDANMDEDSENEGSQSGSESQSNPESQSESDAGSGSDDDDNEDDAEAESEKRGVSFATSVVNSDAERRDAAAYRDARAREHEDEQYTDEIDTPLDCAARERFVKYRGLASFSATRWDPKENLPPSYTRLCEFQDYKHTRKLALRDNRADTQVSTLVQPGNFVCVHLNNVPHALFQEFTSRSASALVLVGLLVHEAKLSVAHALVRRCDTSEPPRVVPSKHTRIEMHIGFRRFLASPIFSEQGAPRAGQYRMLRFFRRGLHCVASTFAPITYPPSNVLLFSLGDADTNGQSPTVLSTESAQSVSWRERELLAVGTLMQPDPNRVVVKRIVLSGHPTKIRRRSAIVRFMFFSAADVEWFKPVALRTKAGASGHIREPLGTHGRMKCVFDRPIRSNDTVTMNLYKRTFPVANSYHQRVPFRVSADADETVGHFKSSGKQRTTEEVEMDELFE